MHCRRKTGHVRIKRSKSTRSKSMRNKTRKNKRSNNKRSKRSRKMRGGNTMLPLIGAPYNAADAMPNGNHLAYNSKVQAWPEQSNVILNDRQMMGVVRAGGGRRSGHKRSGYKHRRSGHKRMRGGSLSVGAFVSSILPDDVLNLGRSIPASLGNMYNNYTGLMPLPSSYVYPTQQPVIPVVSQPSIAPPDILDIYNTANTQVSKM